MMSTVLIDSMSKEYGNGVHALNNLSLALDEGEIFGYLGPNGAGKTFSLTRFDRCARL